MPTPPKSKTKDKKSKKKLTTYAEGAPITSVKGWQKLPPKKGQVK